MSLSHSLIFGTFIALASFLFVGSARLPICHFLMRDINGVHVEVMRKCPLGTSYCAASVSNSTGSKSLVVKHYEYYCENEKNISRQLNIDHAPSSGCYRFGDPDEFVCFCLEDFCNSYEQIEQLFLNIFHHQTPRPVHPRQLPTSTITPKQKTVDSSISPLSFSEELRKLRSPLLTDKQDDWRTQRVRQRRQTPRSFDVQVKTQQFILAEEGTIFKKRPTNFK